LLFEQRLTEFSCHPLTFSNLSQISFEMCPAYLSVFRVQIVVRDLRRNKIPVILEL
jgi:hypothetical protein